MRLPKFKGNQKQFTLNASLDNIFDQISDAHMGEFDSTGVRKLIAEGKELICEWQKLIKIAYSTKDGWQVVNENESDELASGTEDEKRFKTAKDAVSRKRK